jgi:hypothetical protein
MVAGFKSVSTIGNIDHPQLFTQPGLAIPDHQVDVTIVLHNTNDVEIEIPRCTTIGFIENFNNNYLKRSLNWPGVCSTEILWGPSSPPNPYQGKSKRKFLPMQTSKLTKSKHTGYCWPNIMMCSVQRKMTWVGPIILNTKSLPRMKTLPTEIPEAHREGLEKQISLQ